MRVQGDGATWINGKDRLAYGMSVLEGSILRALVKAAELELLVIGAMLREPAEGLARARKEGVHAAMFERDDLRLMWVVMEEFADRGRDEVVVWIKKALVFSRSYFERGAWFDRSDSWCDESLASFACSESSVVPVTRNARKLAEWDRRVIHARRMYYKMVVLLKGEDAVATEIDEAMGEEVKVDQLKEWVRRRTKRKVVVRTLR